MEEMCNLLVSHCRSVDWDVDDKDIDIKIAGLIVDIVVPDLTLYCMQISTYNQDHTQDLGT